jgi:hypothetical protein
MTDTHEDCGNGHSKPIGGTCGICANLDGGLGRAVNKAGHETHAQAEERRANESE